jgi:hypothetical protein
MFWRTMDVDAQEQPGWFLGAVLRTIAAVLV